MRFLFLAATAALSLLAAETSDPAAVKEVTSAMESLKQAMIHKDGAALDKLLSEDLMYTHSAGQFDSTSTLRRAKWLQLDDSTRSDRLERGNVVTRLILNTTIICCIVVDYMSIVVAQERHFVRSHSDQRFQNLPPHRR